MCKVPPANAARREQFQSRPCFIREVLVYKNILPQLLQFQQQINPKITFDAYAKCLAAGDVDMNEFVLMEDLSLQDFLMFDRHQKLDLNHVALVMQELGKFHALSFAMKDQKPEEFKKLSNINDVFFESFVNDYFNMYISSIIDKVVAAMDEDDKCKAKMEQFKDFTSMGKDLTDFKNAEPYAVINHGDCWNNNMLFRYIEGNIYFRPYIYY